MAVVLQSLSRVLELYWPSIILGATGVFLLALTLWFSVRMDPQEPPLLHASIPVIGHLIGIIRHQTSYFLQLEKKNHMPAYTLPILGGKLYVLNSSALVQSAFRNKNLSFVPFMVEFAQNVMSISATTVEPFKAPPYPDEPSPFVAETLQGIHQCMQREIVHKMNVIALKHISGVLNSIPRQGALDVSNWWLYLKDLMTMATTEGLFGRENPWKKQPSLLEDLWIFEKNLLKLVAQPLPWLTASQGYQARARLQKAMIEFYTNKYDFNEDVSGICKVRAAVERKYGIPVAEIGRIEQALSHVATTNSVPTFFWLAMHVFSQPELVQRLSQEILPHVKEGRRTGSDGRKIAAIDIDQLETKCPLLNSCYKEILRIVNGGVHTRRVLNDTTITDGDGNRYLLKKGCNVQMPVRVAHWNTEIWGGNFLEFDPERFLTPSSSSSSSSSSLSRNREDHQPTHDEKAQKRSYYPFGGGRHLCPGRFFALAENLGTLAALILGFELTDPQGGAVQVPPMGPIKLVEATAKPQGDGVEMSGKIRRKKGWEDVEWAFVSDY